MYDDPTRSDGKTSTPIRYDLNVPDGRHLVIMGESPPVSILG